MTDRVFVSNLRLYGFHGVKDAEKSLGQKFHVDIDCRLKPSPKGRADRMDQTVCYGELAELATEISGAETFNLIETLAERLAAAIFDRFDLVDGVRIQIRKPSAPIRFDLDHVGVEIARERNG